MNRCRPTVVNLGRAAELLSKSGDQVARPSLSKYLQQHADVLWPQKKGRETFIDFKLLKAHRQGALKHGGETSERTRADESRDKIAVDRQLRQLDLQERQKQLTPVSEVQEAAYSAVAALRSSFAVSVNDSAETIAAVTSSEARLIRPHLRALEKRALDAFVRVLVDRKMMPSAAA